MVAHANDRSSCNLSIVSSVKVDSIDADVIVKLFPQLFQGLGKLQGHYEMVYISRSLRSRLCMYAWLQLLFLREIECEDNHSGGVGREGRGVVM